MPTKTCFLTVGATAAFPELITAVLTPSVIQSLQSQNYTDLLVQYGDGGKELYEKAFAKVKNSSLKVSGFDLDKAGLGKYMRQAKGGKGDEAGCVIGHAGSGTILDALRTGVPIIVVPNSTLLDDHQVELAEVLASQGYVVHGKLNDLPDALARAEKLRQKRMQWPPVNAGVHREAKGLKGVLDEEMGFLD